MPCVLSLLRLTASRVTSCVEIARESYKLKRPFMYAQVSKIRLRFRCEFQGAVTNRKKRRNIRM